MSGKDTGAKTLGHRARQGARRRAQPRNGASKASLRRSRGAGPAIAANHMPDLEKASRKPAFTPRKKLNECSCKNTCAAVRMDVYPPHPIRTCLWSRVGRWASGQEAGQPPGTNWSRTPDRQPEAKPVHLVLHQGRGLKQRRSGLFWSQPGSTSGGSKRLVLHCRACGGLPCKRRCPGSDRPCRSLWRLHRAERCGFVSRGTSHRRHLRRGAAP